MTFGQMKIDGSGLEVAMTEQRLYGRQIGAAFDEVSRETVAQQMRGDGVC